MKLRALIPALLAPLAPLAPVAPVAPVAISPVAPQEPEPTRVLLVGNSYTYYHNMPAMLTQVGQAVGQPLHVEQIAVGGARLADHLESGAVTERLEQGSWDLVVLQSQSTFGANTYVEGLTRIDGSADYAEAAGKLIQEIEEHGARVFLFQHWRRRAAPERDGQAIDAIVGGLARDKGTGLVPCGLAWSLVPEDLEADLYSPDGSHPSPAGAYLNACTLFAELTGKSPVGAPATMRGAEVEVHQGTVLEQEATLVELKADTARALQELGQRAARLGGPDSVGTQPAPPLALPELPAGAPLTADDLAGTWTGQARHYPRYLPWPASLKAAFEVPAEGPPRIELTGGFGGRPDDIHVRGELHVEEDRFWFEDPDGPNAGVLRYTGVLVDGVVRGVAEMSAGGGAIRLHGTWDLQRP